MKRIAVVAAMVSCVSCNGPLFELDLERMIDQKRYGAYEASEFFRDGRAMRTPPADTVAHDRVTGDPALTSGVTETGYVERIPIAVTRGLIDRGRARYDTFCSPCHGISGDGETMVSAQMELRRPPSLVDDAVRAFPEGRIFQTMTVGYGLMRPYADDLGIEERWAVVAYVRALQLRAEVSLDALPLAMRTRAQQELP